MASEQVKLVANLDLLSADYTISAEVESSEQTYRIAASEIDRLARRVAELEEEVALHRAAATAERVEVMRKALTGLRSIIRTGLSESSGPHRIWINGAAHEGPLAHWIIQLLARIETIADRALHGALPGSVSEQGC